jgi:hypothetical protein
MEFPVHLYRKHPNGTWPVAGREGLHKIASANDADELAAMLANGQGWFMLGDDAPDMDAPVTRAELEQKAAELGIKFHHKTGDAKLAALIAEALEG